MSLFIGLDIGTSAVKAIIVDAEDREQASAEAPLSIERPHPLWSEQHPDVWWTAAAAVLDRLAADHPKLMSGVTALGLSGQMLGVALIDGAGRPIRPAPLWNDGRAAAECAELDATAWFVPAMPSSALAHQASISLPMIASCRPMARACTPTGTQCLICSASTVAS